MGNVIKFPEKKTEDNAEQAPVEFTAELVREYSETLVLAVSVLDKLDKEETDNCFWMLVAFNNILMAELAKRMEEEE